VKPKKKTVDSFLENDDGTFVQITQVEYDEIRGYAKRLTAAADEADEMVTAQIKGLADDVKAAFPDAPIVKDGPDVVEGSLHWRKKDLDSTSRKIQTYARDKNLTYTEAAEQISDSLRYTYIVDEADYIRAVQETMERFAEMGYKNGKFDAAWFKRKDYRGLNINMITPEGVKMELQFHTAKSFEIKNGINHELYEQFRKLSKAKQKGPEGQAFQAAMEANANTIPMPPRIKYLDDLAKIYDKPNPSKQADILWQAKQRVKARERAIKRKAREEEKRDLAKKEPVAVTKERLLKDMMDEFSWQPEDADLVKAQFEKLLKKGRGITVKDRLKLQQDWKDALKAKIDETRASVAKLEAERKAAREALKAEELAKQNAVVNAKKDAVESALKGEFKKLGELPEVTALHVDAYSNAPSYIKSAIGQRSPLARYVTDYSLKNEGGAFMRANANEIWIHGKSHDVRIGLNATWRHEYGHAIDFDLADRFYRLSGLEVQTDKWFKPIISRAFNKSLLDDSRQFQKWKDTAANRVAYTERVGELQSKSFAAANHQVYYDPLLKKYNMTYEQVMKLGKNNFNLPPGQSLDDYMHNYFMPNMLASVESGNVQGFLNIATTHGYKSGGDLSSLSDYVGSITKNKVRGDWGHSDAYYSARRHGPSGKHKEAFANFFGMMGGEDGAFFEALLRAWKTDKYLDDLIGAMKLLEKN
jgi:hypothetical protein